MNSYGVDSVPDEALYGIWDCFNGEWTGIWYFDRESAQKAAAELEDDEQFGIVSTDDANIEWL